MILLTADDILTADELAEEMNVSASYIYKMASKKRIPAQKVGGKWRFWRRAIEIWVSCEENPGEQISLALEGYNPMSMITIKEAAVCLKLAEGTLYNIFNQESKTIPRRKIAGQWRLPTKSLLLWLCGDWHEKHICVPQNGNSESAHYSAVR